ncbi:MAG TPA: sulfate adenylyltransferase, partial [Candidatus Paenalcaligenes intestinipullorum]|nr:sulfate adenylyltransferase [Candidatus Paenalcaligenes intestinipullorum]
VAINKMDLVNWDEAVFNRIQAAYAELAAQVGIENFYAIPISALQGENIAHASTLTPWYQGEALLPLLEHLPLIDTAENEQVRLFVQWVIRHDGHAAEAFRGYAGQLESGHLQVGDRIRVWPSQQEAQIRALYRADQPVEQVQAGDPITIVLDKELDISRGDLLTLANNTVTTTREFDAELCWLDEQALSLPRTYWLKQGSRLTQAKIRTIHQVRDIQTLQPNATSSDLRMNDIASVRVQCRDPLVIEDYAEQPITGSFILIDSATNQTAAAGLVQQIG